MKHTKGFIDLGLAILIGALIIGGAGIYLASFRQQLPQSPIVGSTNVVQAQAFTLSGSGVTATQTTLPLTSFKLSDASTTITMANFSAGVGYGTLEPGTSKEEQVSFTGVTQNADGTAILTGVTRGINFVAPFNSVSTFQRTHAGGTKFVLSNTSAFYSQFGALNATNTWTGIQTFASTSIPQLASDTTNAQVSANGNNLVNYNTLASTSFAGVSPANPTGVAGIGMFSSQSQLGLGTGSSTYLGNTYYLFPWNSYFNTTSTATTTVPVTNSSGKLSQGFLNLSEGWTFGAGVTSTALTNLATTTISSLNVTGTSTVATTTFTGTLTFNVPFAWTQLGSLTTPSATSTITVKNLPNKSSLLVYARLGTPLGGSDIGLQFNGSAEMYRYRYSTNNGVDTTSASSSYAILVSGVTASSTLFVNIDNSSSTQDKTFVSNAVSTNGASFPTSTVTYGVWSNASSINSVTLTSGNTNTFPAGSQLFIYGSPN